MSPGSAIHRAPGEWAEALRRGALALPRDHDRNAILALFRRHSDYYRARIGEADWAALPVLEKADVADIPNVNPTADLTSTCEELQCVFDATGSSDSDGTLDAFDWDFGDGTHLEGGG